MISPIFMSDFYKTDHRRQYPRGTQFVYSNFTARGSRLPGVTKTVFFGLQYFIERYLMREFEENFFQQPLGYIVDDYRRRMNTSIGPDAVPVDHIEDLHALGFLPLAIKALPEGSLVPLRVPLLTVQNTDPRFFWLTNWIETLLSATLWHPITSATIAFEYRKLLQRYAHRTSDIPGFVVWQGHDFSMRGHACVDSAAASGAGHLLSFTGTDTIPALEFLDQYYRGKDLAAMLGGSIPATEHSVMCMGEQGGELETYRRMITEVYPTGMVSIVSDTWDYWNVLTEIIGKELRDEILRRDGKVVVRPDSGDPVKIICGDPEAAPGSTAARGSIGVLWDIFGGTTNSKGYKQLDPHIGCIYGDSITLERCAAISRLLEAQGFASTNMVYGIGSYTYQYVTRDTLGFAMKATWGQVNDRPVNIFKDPKTDDGLKKSARGLLRVNPDFSVSECVTRAEESGGILNYVFNNGHSLRMDSIADIRARVEANLALELERMP